MGDRYHHGDLPNALHQAAREVIDERGVGNFSLREVARRAGVSHTAPAHHFGDMQGLLTSLAIEGFEGLYQGMSDAIAGLDDPVERLAALGIAYVTMAHEHSACSAVMFRPDLVDSDDPRLQEAGQRAYGLLEATVRDLIDSEQLDADLDDATTLCWAAMQGLVVLEPKIERRCEMRSTPMPAIDETVRRFTDFMVNGFRGRRTL